MNDRLPLARHELDFTQFANITLANLASCYTNLKLGTQAEDFIREILNVVGTMDDPAVENPIEIIMQFVSSSDKAKGPDWIASSPYGAIIVSCTYCLRAIGAFKAGRQNLAWSYMADARYWCGVSISSKGLAKAYEHTVLTTSDKAAAEAIQSKAMAGAKGRDKLYEPVREFVYQRVRSRERKWNSMNQAAQLIVNPALEFMAENCKKIKKIPSKESFEKRIKVWLGRMDDAGLLFETLDEASKKEKTPKQRAKAAKK